MRSSLLWKLLAINAATIGVVILVVWFAVDFLAAHSATTGSGTAALMRSGRSAASTKASMPPMQNPITPMPDPVVAEWSAR